MVEIAFILLIPMFGLLIFPAKVLGLELARSRPGVLVKIAGYLIFALGFVPVLFWLYLVYWRYWVST